MRRGCEGETTVASKEMDIKEKVGWLQGSARTGKVGDDSAVATLLMEPGVGDIGRQYCKKLINTHSY